MKRMTALCGALLLTLALTTPAVAVKAVTATVAAAQCSIGVGPDFREWGDEQTWHWRASNSHYEMFLLDEGQWVDNGRWIYCGEAVNLVPNKEGYTSHGRMEVRDSVFGDFAGTWSSNPSTVNVTLKGLDGALYDHLKISVVGQAEGDEGPPTTDVCGQHVWGQTGTR